MSALAETRACEACASIELRYVAISPKRSRDGVVIARIRSKNSAAGVHFFLGALPYVVMGVVVGVEASPERYMGFLPLLSLGPALASVSRGAISTALIGAEALGIC